MCSVPVTSVSSPLISCGERKYSSLFPKLFWWKSPNLQYPASRGSLLQLVSHNKLTLQTQSKTARNVILCSHKKRIPPLWCHHILSKKFDHPYDITKILGTKRQSGNGVVRCDIAGAASTDFAFHSLGFCLLPRIRGICFYAVTAVAAIFLIVLMLVGHPFVLLFDPHRRKFHHLIARIWATITVYPFLKIEYEGLENMPPPDTPAVYVSNHQSFLDIYTLFTLGRGFKFISKTGIFIFPIIGWAMFMMGVIPLKRMDSRSQMDCLKRCMYLLKKGGSVFFFPEGTRSKDGKPGPFKKGAFSVASRTGVPVVPITLVGTGKIMPAGKEGNLNQGSVKVIIHKPIEGNNAGSLCSQAQDAITNVPGLRS